MNSHQQLSKFLSLILRHQPEKIDLQLNAQGWVSVEHLLKQMAEHGQPIDLATLQEIVAHSDKQRFAFNSDYSMIRANQGHSIEVDLAYEVQTPPDSLYHGSAIQFRESILKHGLVKGQRHHVHLSADTETASKVGQRHGKLDLYRVFAQKMHQADFKFYCSSNGVWLVDAVPVEYLELIESRPR